MKFLLLVVFIAAVRWFYVLSYAHSMPFYDQWDAEGAFLLKPWIEGRYSIMDLWQPHNEHRILPTRLVTLLTFYISDIWDNLPLARLNVLFATLTPALLIYSFLESGEQKTKVVIISVVIACIYCLPFDWENILIGFQSQIYFLLFFNTTAIVIAATKQKNLFWFSILLLLSILSVLTMASGCFTPLVVIFVFVLRERRGVFRSDLCVICCCLLIIFLIGFAIIPRVAIHELMRARGLVDFVLAAARFMSWPWKSNVWAFVIFWLPALLTLRRFQHWSKIDVGMVGITIWTLLQIASLAYGRGHDLHSISSRYMTFLAPGLIANCWFVLSLDKTAKPKSQYLTYSYFLFLLVAVALRTGRDISAMRERSRLAEQEQRNVQQYLETGNQDCLFNERRALPYPKADRLKELLDDKSVRKMLGRRERE